MHVLGRFTGVEISANELGKPIYICSRSFAVRGTQRRFPPNPLKTLFRLSNGTFRSLEMHFKRRYKIYICSVILGELESFEITRASVLFSQKL